MTVKDENSEPLIKSANLFPVVGIGASAGGLDAFKRVIKAIPENSGMAYVLVQHLDPSHDSLLPELLQKVTKIPVLEITDDIKVYPDHIYIIPSNKMMVANDGVLQLQPRVIKKNELNLPIDLFFASLAEIHQSHAIGVVLSGTGSDGTKGLKIIKDYGGITFAQDEESAAYNGMPKSAIQADVVDFILTPESIPQKLLEIIPAIAKTEEDLQNLPRKEEDSFKQILALLRIRKGTDFTYYKQTTVRRRILRRMALNKDEDPGKYLSLLRENKNEQDILYQDLLIPVTSFFRDPKVFDNLCESVFPDILKNKSQNSPIRVWVAGCSTGQEAYSIAICLKEFFIDNGINSLGSVQIFATDLSEIAIVKARAGIYSKNELDGLTNQRLHEFFTKTNDGYQVNKEIRACCIFAAHNFLKDPPFGKVDFISCRNVLIYMEPYLQKKALTTFHYALNIKGYLLLGKSETSGNVPDLFASVSKGDKLYSKKDVPGKFMQTTSQRIEQNLSNIDGGNPIENLRTDFQKTADDIILNNYTPAGVVVNEAMDIVHFRGKTSDFLEQLTGKPSHNILQMAKSGLAFEIRNILHKAKKDKTIIIKDNIPLQINGNSHIISIEAIPLPNIVEPHYLILFHKKELSDSLPETKKNPNSKTKSDDKALRIKQLELELAHSREDMRSITEDQEAVNEELQSANEELLSGSEELQSLNEELESSKEELQSTNEELSVVNQEMIGLNELITIARDYSEAIISTLPEPLLVLDKDLRIKTVNGSFYKTFKVNEKDTEGILIYNLGNRQWNIPSLRTLLEEILPEKSEFSDFEVRHNFPDIGERVMLLNGKEITTDKGNQKLILLAIRDITERSMFQQKERELLNRFYNIVLQVSVGITIFRGNDFVVEMANEAFLKIIDKKEKDFVAKPLFSTLPETRSFSEPPLQDVLKTGNSFYGNEIELTINRFGKSEKCYFNFGYMALREINGDINGIVCVATEVTDIVIARKKMEAEALMVQNMLMNAPAFICTLSGPEHTYNLVNERYQNLFGKRKIQGKPVMEALPELKGQGIDILLNKVYTTAETYVGFEIPITLARDENLEPELRYFNFSYQPIYDENKVVTSILVFGYEVTEEVNSKNKNLEIQKDISRELEEKVKLRTSELFEASESLKQKNEALIKINLDLESFTYVASHDLQEPLRKIQTFANRILEKEHALLSDNGKDCFSRMHAAATRMQILINDLLQYSQIELSDESSENSDLDSIMEEVKNDLQDYIEDKKAIIEYNSFGKIHIPSFKFRQLMTNLINNSLKFSLPDNPPHITIKNSIGKGSEFGSEKLSQNKTYHHICVSDNGIGFEPQYQNQIFEVFKRLHGKSQYSGTGIGLAIVKKIVDSQNGVIVASGELNKGCSFDIYFPVVNGN